MPPQLGFTNCLKQTLSVCLVSTNGFPSSLYVLIGQPKEYQLDLILSKAQTQFAEDCL